MKKVIICIHGLGNKPPKQVLQRWWKYAILEGIRRLGIMKKMPDFEFIYWADILHDSPLDNREKDKDKPTFISEPYRRATKNYLIEDHSFRQKIAGFMTEQLNRIFLNDDKTLNYTFITDIILKKFFRDLDIYYEEECENENNISCKARDLIQERVAEVIKKYKDHDILIIAHSMGSIIVYDVLNFLVPEIEINTLVTIGSPLGLPVVVSKIADEQKHRNIVANLMTTPPGIRGNWFNLADIKDYVALNYKLADDFSNNDQGVYVKDLLVNNDYEINGEKNPHKSFGYLRTPELSSILDEFIGDASLNLVEKVLVHTKNFLHKVNEKQIIVKKKLKLN